MNVILETQRAVFAKLTGDAVLMGMVKGVYDHVPDGAEYPYVTIGDFLANDDSTFGAKAYQLDLNVNVYSKAKGRKEVLEIMERVRELLDGVKLEISGFVHTGSKLRSMNVSKPIYMQALNGRTFFKMMMRAI